jgi:hypothetical protein
MEKYVLGALQKVGHTNMYFVINIRGPFEKFVDWWQCAAVMPPSA